MITLSLDTATPTPGLALARGEDIVDERALASEGAGRRVAQDIHEILADNGLRIQDVGRIVVGVGPGGPLGSMPVHGGWARLRRADALG